MKKMCLSMAVVTVFMALFCFSKAWAGDAVKADNSGVNARDKSGQTVTPMDQSADPDDLRITTDIRKSLMEDKSLSMNAKNIKIITAKGVITVRGPVDSLTEKKTIENYVRKIAGRRTVDNLLQIKPRANATS